jgi:hypothetical protein
MAVIQLTKSRMKPALPIASECVALCFARLGSHRRPSAVVSELKCRLKDDILAYKL